MIIDAVWSSQGSSQVRSKPGWSMHTAPDQIKSSSFSFQSFSSERSFPICNPKQGGFERVPRPFCQIVWHTCSEKTWLLYCHCPIKLDHSPASKCNIYLCWQILIRIPKHFFRCVSLSVSGVWADCSHSPVFVRGKKVALCRGWNAVRQCACGRPWLDEPAPTSSAVRAQAARCVLAGWAQTGRASSETGCRTIGPQPAYALSSWKSTPWTKALILNSVWISRLLVDCNFCENYLDLLPVPRPSWQ